MAAHFHILDRIGTTAGSHLHRARIVADGSAVVLKLSEPDNHRHHAARFRREYEMLRALDVPGVVKPRALSDDAGRPMMVLDHLDGEPLDAFLGREQPDWPQCLRIGAQLAHILAGLHAARIVHRDFRPANMMLLADHTVCLVDLNLATLEAAPAPAPAPGPGPSFASDTAGAANGIAPVGDWAYVSPEQTGRMKRAVDFRTDFYTLGVTLYRMLTGQLPCQGNDALEWAHCHLASLPRAPPEFNPAIPPTVSAIVLRLLEKMPEDRYQSASGLEFDLRKCLEQWEARGEVLPFALGARDIPEHLRIPHTLVGRDAEVRQLLDSFDAMAASGSARVVLVAGGAGVGKTALVRQLDQPIRARHGFFISGKFDQYQRDIPYATITQAFRDLVQQILAENEDGISAWRRQIAQAVGANGQLIADVLPQVELIIGAQAPVPQLPPTEAQNRFRTVFQKFIGVFAQQAHPLTLFLDDLQWADGASLRLLRELAASPERRFLLVIGAYRDNEVGPAHPLALAIDEMRREGAALAQIELAPLSEAALGDFLDAMLYGERGASAPLAHLVYQKTGGNPFFMIEFIRALADERAIAFDPGSRTWRWDLARIGAAGYTDNVAELMIGKLARLPGPAQAVLQRLACLGAAAPEATLAMLAGEPPAGQGADAQTGAALAAAAQAGLVVRADGMAAFLHDRVQEAAYLSMPPSARAALHLQIGRRLVAGKSAEQLEDEIFLIVGQFNRGRRGIVDGAEKALLRRLNFLAGMKARTSTAYASARRFLGRAMALEPAGAWQAQYQDTLALTLALSECEYCAGHFARADRLAERALANAQSRGDKARVYRLRIDLYQMAGRYDDALQAMFAAAGLYGEVFPTAGPEIEAAIDAEIGEIAAALAGRPISGIAEAPQLADGDMGMVIAMLVEALAAAYFIRPDYFALMTARAVKLSLLHGNTEDSCTAYSIYGLVLLSRLGDVETGCEFSRMALLRNRKFDGRRLRGRLLLVHAVTFCAWNSHVAEVTPMLDEAFGACLEVGDLVYANYVALWSFWPMLQQGVALDAVLDALRRHAGFARASHNEPVYRAIRFQQQLVACLNGRGGGAAAGGMDDDGFDRAGCLAALEQARFGVGIQMASVASQVCAFIRGDHAGALAAAQQASGQAHHAGTIIVIDATHSLFLALTAAALHARAGAAEQGRLAGVLAAQLERQRLWARHCPQNFGHCHALAGAEAARIAGRDGDAARLYEEALRGARENGFVQHEAIAFELASAFYRARGFALIADTYLRHARACYLRWGADAKVAQLDALYPALPAPQPALALAAAHDAARLDLLSVAKASQAISSRIVLVELVDTLMHIVLENAGAQAGCLLLVRNADLALAAEARVAQAGVDVQVHMGKKAPEAALPASIVNYVRRSREAVLLPDVAQPGPFSGDPYFSSSEPKSVLCLPILRQDALVGLLYLENKLVTHAFAPERVAVLKLLASQAAISLENATLYADLHEREAKIRRLVDSNIVGILFFALDGTINGANDAALAMIGYGREELLDGRIRWQDLTPPEWRAADAHAVESLQLNRTCRPFEKEYVRKDGSRVPVLIAAALFEGSSDQGVAFALDLTERKRAEEQVRHMANHDALTGLPNRTLLQDRLSLAIAYAHRNRSQVAVLFIDLDYFKHINDSLGHHIGDLVLQMTAARLQKFLREGDSVARLGGDEFVICLPFVADSAHVARVAGKVLDALAEPFFVERQELHVSGSIGISLYPEDGADVETLMRTADTAMYHAKEMGRSNFQFFTAMLNEVAQQRLEVGRRLRHALVHDEFVLHYQPQVDMENGTIFSAEALLRWQPAGKQPISCGNFIGHAEESGLIVPIGEWALRQACRQLKIWRDAGHPDLKMAVNVSPRQLEPPGFCAMVGQILAETGIPASALELEITESILLQRSDFNLSTLNALRDMGIQLSVDDFGTGYSSLSYLQRFPVRALKIDQSFVRDIGTDPNHTALITAIIAMANSLHLSVIAEGVETWEQAKFLIAHGCLSAQGFYYSEGLPAQAFFDLLYRPFACADEQARSRAMQGQGKAR